MRKITDKITDKITETTTKILNNEGLPQAVKNLLDSYNKGMGKTNNLEIGWKLSNDVEVVNFDCLTGRTEVRFHLLPETLILVDYAHLISLLLVELVKSKPTSDYLKHVSTGKLALKHGEGVKPNLKELLTAHFNSNILLLIDSVKRPTKTSKIFEVYTDEVNFIWDNLELLGHKPLSKLSEGLNDVGIRVEFNEEVTALLIGE